MNSIQILPRFVLMVLMVAVLWQPAEALPTPDFNQDVMPILTRYCAGCHNEDDQQGEFSLATFEALRKGGENGAVLKQGDSQASRLIQVLTGAEPAMPPEGEPAPTDAEIEILRRWIDTGAQGPSQASDPVESPVTRLPNTPDLSPSATAKPITSVAFSPDGTRLAVARFRDVELLTSPGRRFVQRLSDHPGKVNDLRFTRDGRYLIAATGIVGVVGETRIWDVNSGKLHQRLGGHRDVIYAAVASDDGELLATAGYDRVIVVWNLRDGSKLHELAGHNGPVLDLAFSPDGRILASASADATVKIWHVQDGRRLDTLSQPLKEQHTVDISPDGKFVIAGGQDNRIRLWRLVSVDRPRINPLRFARFAHEQAIERVRFTGDGSRIVSLAADRQLKVWSADQLTQLSSTDVGQDVAQAMAVNASGDRVAIGRMDGALTLSSIDSSKTLSGDGEATLTAGASDLAPLARPTSRIQEQEPNDRIDHAQSIPTPARVSGVIYHDATDRDVDLFRFRAAQGQQLILEVRAARDKSPLDSKISVLTVDGDPVPRLMLRAVRDSYFNFRGKNSDQTGDFRVHNWREMQLNQLLYASGEVVKLYHYPRGPDSGFNVYPNFGKRHAFFDTTAVTHALHEPCYIVEPYAPGTQLPPNGLPTFLLNYENDDESQRRYGSDSYLTFTAPHDGEFVVRVEDVRGLEGADFKYELIVRSPEPDFRVSIMGENPTVPLGAGRKFEVRIERIDGFDGEVSLEIENVPPGFEVTSPIVVQAGQLRAWGAISAAADAESPGEDAPKTKFVATALINNANVRREVGSLGKIKVGDAPKLFVRLTKSEGDGDSQMPVIEMEAGTTTTALIRIDRQGHQGRVGFGSEEAVFNAPHGVYVDNIGLNGVLITESQNQRLFYITAEPWVPPTERIVFVESGAGGKPTSNPVLLRIK